MKKEMKKALSVLMVIIITLSVAPAGVFKANAADIDYLTYKIENGEATITGCDVNATGEITIPDEIEGAKVTRIGNSAFRKCSLLQNITIPDSVTSIGMQAFNGCSFEEITIPDGVTKISDGLFMYCSSLKKVNLPEKLISIGAQVFYDCINLSEISIPDTVSSIEMQAFSGCESLVSVKIPDGVTELSNSLFYECSSLETVFLPDDLVSIEKYAFAYCFKLTDINIPKTVTSIGEAAFIDCDTLQNVKFPYGVTQISDHLFYGCSSLQSVVLPETITSVGSYAFFNSTLTDVFYYGSEEQWKNISVSSNNGKLTSAVVHFDYLPNTGSCGESVTWNYYEDTKTLAVVGGGAMYDYDSPEDCEWYDLKNNIELVTVSGKVESVGENAFSGYPNLKEVYLGSSTQKVGENAFDDCPNLSLVSSTASTLIIGANAFKGCNDRMKFVCYSANDGLPEFANEDDLIKVSFDPEQKALKFNGELTVYPDLNYEFLNRFLMNNNGAEYIFFSKLIFHGVEPDIVDVEDLENDASAQYLTFTNLYISLRAVKNGAQENITFGEMLELLEGGDYDAFIFDLNSDESNQEVTVPSWKKTIDNFIEDVVKAVSKLINFVAKLFRRK